MSAESASRLLRGAGWLSLGGAAGRLAGFCGSVIGARLLGSAGFGQFTIVQSTVGMVAGYTGLGLGSAAAKYIAGQGDDLAAASAVVKKVLHISMFLAITAAVITLLTSPVVASSVLRHPELAAVLAVAALMVFVLILNEAHQGALSGLRRFGATAQISVATGVATLVFVIALTPWLGVIGFVLAQAAGIGVGVLLARRSIAAATKGVVISHGPAVAELLGFGIVLFAANAIIGPTFWLVAWKISQGDGGMGELGVWGVSQQIRNMTVLLPGFLAQVAFPQLSYEFGANRPEEVRRTLEASVALTFVAVVPIACIAMLAGEQVLAVFGDDFRGGGLTMAALLAGTICHAVGVPVAHVLTVMRLRLYAVFNVAWCVIMIGTTWVLVPSLGALGAGLAFLLANATSILLASAAVAREGAITRATFLRIGVASLAAGLVLGGLWIRPGWPQAILVSYAITGVVTFVACLECRRLFLRFSATLTKRA